MDCERIEPEISLNDPGSRFHFESSDDGALKLQYRDWQNRRVVIRFNGVAHFAYGFLSPDTACTEGDFCRTTASLLIDRLRQRQILGPDETAFHYLIGSNEDEWCEIVAASHNVTFEPE